VTNSWLARWQDFAAGLDWAAAFHGGALASLALRLYREFLRTDAAAPLAIEGLTLEILAEAWRGSVRGLDRTPPGWLARVHERVHECFAEQFTLQQLAKQAGVHPVHLGAAFRQQYGCTVGQYVRRRRIEFACQQLTTSNAALADIALAAGFADQSHFCRTFKWLTGLRPAGYRKSADLP
jgi:AraC family transcriptional regulator